MRKAIVGLLLSLALGCGSKPTTSNGTVNPVNPTTAPAPPGSKSPQDVQREIWGMSADDVRRKYGPPDSVNVPAIADPNTSGDSVWSYGDGKQQLFIRFEQGRVVVVTR